MHNDDDDAEGCQDCQWDLICEFQAGSSDAAAAELIGASTFDDVVVCPPTFRPDVAESVEIVDSEYGAEDSHRSDQRMNDCESSDDFFIIQPLLNELILNRNLV